MTRTFNQSAMKQQMQAEIERLKVELELSGLSEVRLEAEVARLRAALEIVAATRAQALAKEGK